MTKPSSKNVSPNKLSDDEKRRAEQIRSRLQKQGMGEDEAWHRAIEMAAQEVESGEGGGSSAGG
jgi:hypothetical protein